MSKINQISSLGNWMITIYSREKEALKKDTGVVQGWGKAKDVTQMEIMRLWHHCHTKSSNKGGWHCGEGSEQETEICESEAKSHRNGEIA